MPKNGDQNQPLEKIFQFSSPGSLVFGPGSLMFLNEKISRQKAKRVFIVTDKNLQKCGIVDQVVSHIQGVEIGISNAITPEPPVECIVKAYDEAKAFRPDLIIGLGGGSNMDAAKLVSMMLAHNCSPTEYVGDSKVPGPIFPILCIPTTAGTGSEVSPAAVFTDTANKMKVSTLSNFLIPNCAIVDSNLLENCPKNVLAESGIDALTHAIEAFCAPRPHDFYRRSQEKSVYQADNPISSCFAQMAIALIGPNLKNVVLGKSLDASHKQDQLDDLARAATAAGLAFSNSGVALVHAMEYPVGGAVHVSHGAGNGLLLPYVMRYNKGMCLSHYDIIGYCLNTDVDVIDYIEKLRKEIGIPTRLRDIGVKQEMLPGFAEKAFSLKRLMRTNSRFPKSSDEILRIYEQAF